MKEKLSHSRVLKELELTTKDWFNYLRMGISAFSLLLEKITPIIQKEGTCMRKAITRAFIKPDLKTDLNFFFHVAVFLFIFNANSLILTKLSFMKYVEHCNADKLHKIKSFQGKIFRVP